jgi:hypothetical protein
MKDSSAEDILRPQGPHCMAGFQGAALLSCACIFCFNVSFANVTKLLKVSSLDFVSAGRGQGVSSQQPPLLVSVHKRVERTCCDRRIIAALPRYTKSVIYSSIVTC